jgi:hypothetical protein
LAPRTRCLRTALSAAACVAAVLAAGCGDDGDAEREPKPEPGGVIDISGTEAVGENLAGSVASLVECRDWNGANAAQRLATIRDVRSQVSRQDAGISVPSLTDQEAAAIFDKACAPAWAQGLRLYKLYARAAGFVPLARAIERK